jgi:UDP-N-acetylmuramoyl-L-alanyl-D-glutamate--2,6-diaminopimelate ligase
VVIAAILDEPDTVYGGVAAAPLFQHIARYAIQRLGIEPSAPWRFPAPAGRSLSRERGRVGSRAVDPTFPQVRLADVAAVVGAEVRGDPDDTVRDASHDSRDVPAGSLFFCIPGEHVDGHAFAQQAVDAGAAALVVDHPLAVARPARGAVGPRGDRTDGRCGVRASGAGAHGRRYHRHERQDDDHLSVGVVFRAAGWRPGVIGTTGMRIDGSPSPLSHTTPEAPELHGVGPDARGRAACVAIEISSHALASTASTGSSSTLRLHEPLAGPLDLHGRWRTTSTRTAAVHPGPRPARRRERGRSLGRRLLDDPAIRDDELRQSTRQLTCADDVSVDGRRAKLVSARVEVRTALRGRFNVENVLAALAAAAVVGIELDVGARGVGEVQRVPGRMEPVDAGRLHGGSGLRTYAG